MAKMDDESKIGAVVFRRETLGLYAVFGSALLTEKYECDVRTSVIISNTFERLPQELLDASVVAQGTIREGKEFGLGNINVLFLPWSLLPIEFGIDVK